MGRVYDVPFKNVTIAAAQDLVALKGSTGKICRLRRVWFYMNDTTLQTAQGLRLNVKFSTATITLGSGGATPTPAPHDAGDSAAAFTAHTNDTSQATTSGAFTDRMPAGGHNYAGFDFSWPKGEEIVFGLNQGVVFELLSTVTGTCNYSGGATIEEVGL